MIQLNLLPDVKMEYLKAQRSQRLVMSVSLLVSAAAVVLLVFLVSVDGLQRKHITDLTHDINKDSTALQNEPSINKILTVQNQLNSLTSLHQQKPNAAALFNYLNDITPTKVAITNFTVDFTQQTMTITGTSDTLTSVNQYVDTLKLTTYSSNSGTSGQQAFSNVVLSSFGLNTESTDLSQAASYTITLAYNKDIFDITQTITLNVPTTTVTRVTSSGGDLFKTTPPSSGTGSH